VNGRHWNTCKLVFLGTYTGTWTHTRVYVNAPWASVALVGLPIIVAFASGVCLSVFSWLNMHHFITCNSIYYIVSLRQIHFNFHLFSNQDSKTATLDCILSKNQSNLYLNENIALTDLAVLFCMLVIGSFMRLSVTSVLWYVWHASMDYHQSCRFWRFVEGRFGRTATAGWAEKLFCCEVKRGYLQLKRRTILTRCGDCLLGLLSGVIYNTFFDEPWFS